MKKFKEQFLQTLLDLSNSNSIAFCIADKFYSYQQLFAYVEQIYNTICGCEDELIGLYATDDIRTYASILALWFHGKTYIPLNPNQPIGRHEEVITSLNTHTVISSNSKYKLLIEGTKIISTNDFTHENYTRRGELKISDVSDSSLAYVIFTSGSTGQPKGVQISRGNLAAFIDSMNNIGLDITPEDRCLQPFDLTFDFSVSGFVIPLVKGASIFTVPLKATKFTYIAGLVEDYQLTVLQMVPSMIRNLLPYLDEVDLSSVRYNILCGEALTGKVIKKWHSANERMISYNMYGPTEDTVFCTNYIIDKSNINHLLANNDIISIGKSFKNSECVLINDLDEVINSSEEVGELCLCGKQLSPGYWHNSLENSVKFFPLYGKRYYKTGDLCYRAYNGDFMFVSRKDFQVKINGFRVELEEIENHFFKISGGRYSVVVPYENAQSNTELAMVIEGKEYDISEHRTLLSSLLPAYEIPSKFLFIKNIPLNQNGKVDRKEIKRIFNLK